MKTTRDDDAGGSRTASSDTATDRPSSTLTTEFEPNNAAVSWRGWLVLFLGWVLPQVLLIGPAIVGNKTLVPWDLLTLPRFYLPSQQSKEDSRPINLALTDLILVDLPAREFIAREYRLGRLPLWQPANFLGAPFTAWPKYSPFEVPYWFWPCQQSLAWIRLLQSLCTSVGAWIFLRRAIGVSFWPAAAGSSCWPLIGFITLWQGFPLTGSLAWFPWMLTAVHFSVERPFGLAAIGLALMSSLTILSGQPDVGGLALLGSGFYAASRLLVVHGWQRSLWFKGSASLILSWALGFMLAAPYWLPLVEYARSGVRLHDRLAGSEERPPAGWRSLAMVICPDAFGNTRQGSIYVGPGGNLLESCAGAFAGVLATLWLAPLAFADRSRRSQAIFWFVVGVFGIAWSADIPGIVSLMRLPPLNTLSYNRAVFLSSISIVVLASIGLEQILGAQLRFRRWFLIPFLVCVACSLGFLAFAIALPDVIRTHLPNAIRLGRETRFKPEDVITIQRSFVACYATTASLCLAAGGGWLSLIFQKRWSRWITILAIIAMLGELIAFASNESRLRQWQPGFPRIPLLEKLATRALDRTWGVRCLPPNLNQTHGLKDVRGYDAVDPEPVVKLLALASDPRFRSVDYAKSRDMVPALLTIGNRTMFHPIVNLLGIRYFISHAHSGISWPLPVLIQDGDYSISENTNALPRAFVPKSVRRLREDEIVDMMDRIDFDPSEVAFVTENLDLPEICRGNVTLRETSSVELELTADMETDGLIVLSDMWDSDWMAHLDGRLTRVIRSDTTLRGVRVPAGTHTIQMSYQPASVRLGFQLCVLSLLIVGCWAIQASRAKSRRHQ